MIDKQTKQQVIGNFRQSEYDTGSSHVQVAMLTENIKALTEHCRQHPKDTSSRRGLLKMVSKRKRFLKYLQNRQPSQYVALVQSLGLKK